MRRIAVGVVALGVVFALTGCGGGGGGTNAVSIKTLKTAAAATTQTESMRFTADISGDLLGDQFTSHATGVTSGDGAQSQVRFTSDHFGDSEIRAIDGVVYMDLGGDFLGSFLPEGKHWVRLDSGDPATGSLLPFGADPLQGSTPQSSLDLLQDLTGGVETIGDDTVAGRHATHYRGSIDDAPVDVWIDDAGRVVKMHLSMGLPGTELTWEVTEFGVPVEVEAPPPDEVTSFEDLLPGGLRGHDGIPA